jgi:hypothetical protein
MKGKVDIVIVPARDIDMRNTKLWMISKGISYKIIYVPTDTEKQPLFLASMTRWERLLYRLTFGFKSERMTVFG